MNRTDDMEQKYTIKATKDGLTVKQEAHTKVLYEKWLAQFEKCGWKIKPLESKTKKVTA